MPEEPKAGGRVSTQSKDYREYYANTNRFRIGDNEVMITFAAEMDDHVGESYIQDQVKIIMTPRAAKLLSIALAGGLERLEAVIGTIPIPDDVMAKVKGAVAGAEVRKPHDK